MFATLRARLWLSYAVVVTAALGIVGVVLFAFLLQSPLLYREASGKLLAVRNLLDRRQVDAWAQQSPAELAARIAQVDENFDVRVVIFDASRGVVADSRAGLPVPNLPRLLAARNFVLDRDGEGNPWIYSLRKLGGRNWLMLAVPRPRLAALTVLRDELFAPLLGAGLAGLGLALLMAYLISRWVADPLQQVMAASQRMPEDDSRPLPMRGPREVQNLLKAFNAMTARVQASQRSQRDFVANVSHELKTPITSIQGFAQAILDDTAATPEARRQSAQVIYNEAARMHRMVLDLLDLARLDSGMAQMKREPVDVAALLRGVAEKFAPQAQAAGVTLSLDPSPLPALTGDGDRLAQVFTNLVDNALKFTPPGGEVRLEARALPGQLQVDVRDSGPGLAPDQAARIFDRFYQADPARPGGKGHGVGLGLAIVREIVQAHGGKITVRSTPGQGSTFTVILPLAPPGDTSPPRRHR